jgi:hypothetical protein
MTLSALGIFSAAGAGGPVGTYELIETVILGSTTASVTFSNLGTYASTYKHLQIRATYRSNNGGTGLENGTFRLNGDSGNNYSFHNLSNSGGGVTFQNGVSQSFIRFFAPNLNTLSSHYASSVFDILDPYSTSKNKTVRLLTGSFRSSDTNAFFLGLFSGAWYNTASTTSITLGTPSSFVAGSRFSIYGIR